MVDRVFPNNTTTDMGSKIEFNGIDWNEVETNMQNNRFAQDKTSEIINMISQLTSVPENEIREVVDTAQERFDHSSSADSDSGILDDSIPVEANSKKNVKTAKLKKIAFESPDQISAEAIEEALQKGDQRLVNTILAARKENRLRIASAIKANESKKSLTQTKENQDSVKSASSKTAQTSIWTKAFSGQPEKLREAIDVMKASGINTSEAEIALTHMEPTQPVTASNDKENTSMKFASPTEFTKSQKLAFNQAAMALGMPKEYVEAMTSKALSAEVEKLNHKMKEVIASSISAETKNLAISNLIKEAKLSADSKADFLDYWNNVLGYQEKDFWKDVAEEYGTTKDN